MLLHEELQTHQKFLENIMEYWFSLPSIDIYLQNRKSEDNWIIFTEYGLNMV